tara:strand:+ start:48 stop:305 length:258 start_codon:yes stop_codon:yes gene_type:complete
LKQVKFIIIPTVVRADKNLPDGAKLLYGDLKALTKQQGYCFATNKHLADLFGKTEITISNWISKLKKGGYIKIEYQPFRRIFCTK